jgi:predicted dehydrogenase
MRVIVVGLGVQGRKRVSVAGADCVATVDPAVPDAAYGDLSEVPAGDYDGALVCTPDAAKRPLLETLLGAGKHVLVEKPLGIGDSASVEALGNLARTQGLVCYTAYNHRFEPHFVRMREVIQSGRLGDIYTLRMFYGNGTARLVRDSEWRDQGSGVLADLGSHLLDTVEFWVGERRTEFELIEARRFENRAFDFVSVLAPGLPSVHLEMSLLCWRNHFYADVFGSRGSAHIRSLCKWGPSSFTVRERRLPSGRPDEETSTLVQPDPTWALEYSAFKEMCADPPANGHGNTGKDIWIDASLASLAERARQRFPE